MRLTKAIIAYLEYVLGRSDTKKTWLRTRGVLSRFLEIAGNKTLENVNPFDVSAYLADCRRRGNKRSTRDTNVKQLSGFWTWLQENEITEKRSPIRSIHRFRGITHAPPKTISEEEWPRIRAACETYVKPYERARAAGVVAIAEYTGMRKSEITGLTVDDVDWAKKRFRVKGKGSRVRWQPIPEVANGPITQLWNWSLASGFKYLVSSSQGNRMSDSSFHNMWARILRKAGVPHVPFHSTRHSYAVRFARSGHGLKVIQALLGHASLTTTETYLRALDVEEQKIEAVRKEFEYEKE